MLSDSSRLSTIVLARFNCSIFRILAWGTRNRNWEQGKGAESKERGEREWGNGEREQWEWEWGVGAAWGMNGIGNACWNQA